MLRGRRRYSKTLVFWRRAIQRQRSQILVYVTLVRSNSGFDVKGFENRSGKYGGTRENTGEHGRTREDTGGREHLRHARSYRTHYCLTGIIRVVIKLDAV